MAYPLGNKDSLNFLCTVGGVVLFAACAFYWAQQTLKRHGSPQDGGPSFQAVKEIRAGTVRTCPTCGGKGRATCSECGGYGQVNYIPGGIGPCRLCGGSKISVCYRCKGKGTVSDAQPGVLKWKGGKKR